MQHAPHGVLRAFDVGGGSGQAQRVAVGVDAYIQFIFERREILIELAEKADAIFEIA